jgi:hypothetical protein
VRQGKRAATRTHIEDRPTHSEDLHEADDNGKGQGALVAQSCATKDGGGVVPYDDSAGELLEEHEDHDAEEHPAVLIHAVLVRLTLCHLS